MKQLSLLPAESSTQRRRVHPLFAERWAFVTNQTNFRSAEREAIEHARIKKTQHG